MAAEGGTHYLVARSKLGRYVLDRDAFLVGDPTSRYHAGRLLHHRGSWHFFAWQHLDDHGRSWGCSATRCR